VNSNQPRSTFLDGHVSAPSRCCRLKLLHMLDSDWGLLTHTPPGMEVPPTIFNNENLKIGLKFSI